MTEEYKFSDRYLKSYFTNTKGKYLDKELDNIHMDHCYSRPWNWRPETSFLRPTKTLFMQKSNRRSKKFNQCGSGVEEDEFIDIDVEPQPPPAIYDTIKAKHLMEECERYASFARVNEGNEDWENTTPRHNWTSGQNKLFNNMAKILNDDKAARLAYAGNWNEPILRRTIIDKSVKRTRQLMASISWDTRLTQWLHLILIDNLSTSYLAAYLDILQTLRCKLPTFVDKMMFGPSASTRIGVTSNESLFPLLKRQWDPVASSLAHDKPKKLPGNPVIVIVPSSPTVSGPHPSKKLHKWTTLLSHLASVITVHANVGHRITMMSCADQMFAATRAKVQEIRSDCPGRPIILAGFNSGAAIACQIAQVEPCLAVVCLGFPLLTTEGRRGEADDILLDIQSPTLFIIGQCAYVTSQEDMEDLRERMRVETGLIVVGGADDYLRISKNKKRTEGITQSIVDRCVVDEVGEFIGSILLSPYPPQIRPPSLYHQNEAIKRSKMDRKRNNSNGSSIESEPPSPQPMKVSRPVGRPPGTKKKLLMDPKPFPPQLVQGTSPSIPISPTPNTNPSPNSDTYTSDTASASTNRSISMSDDLSINITSEIDNALENAVKSILPKSQITTTSVPITASTGSHLHSMPQYTNRNMMTPNNSTLSSLLQAAAPPNPRTSQPSSMRNSGGGGNNSGNSVKILENIQVSSGTSSAGNKLMSSAGRLIDMSKITVLNSLNAQKNSNLGNVILLPDGSKCMRNLNSPTIKTTGGTPMMIPFTHKTPQPVPKRVAKYITSKKQLLNNAPHPNSRVPTSYVTTHTDPLQQHHHQTQNKLPSPSSLTTADIMDLPIIFADNDSALLADINNQNSQLFSHQTMQSSATVLLTSTAVSTSTKTNLPQATISNTNTGKYVFINKQPVTSSSQPYSQGMSYQCGMKRPMQQVMPRAGPQPGVKYTKIILSKRGDDPSSNGRPHQQMITKVANLSHDLNQVSKQQHKNDDVVLPFDLETELTATAVPKPQHHISKSQQERLENVDQGKNTAMKTSGLLEAVLKRESPMNLKKPSTLPPTSRTLNQLFQDLDSNNIDDPDMF